MISSIPMNGLREPCERNHIPHTRSAKVLVSGNMGEQLAVCIAVTLLGSEYLFTRLRASVDVSYDQITMSTPHGTFASPGAINASPRQIKWYTTGVVLSTTAGCFPATTERTNTFHNTRDVSPQSASARASSNSEPLLTTQPRSHRLDFHRVVISRVSPRSIL